MAGQLDDQNYMSTQVRIPSSGGIQPQKTNWGNDGGILKSATHSEKVLFAVIGIAVVGIIVMIFFNPFIPKQKIPAGYKVINEYGELPRLVPAASN